MADPIVVEQDLTGMLVKTVKNGKTTWNVTGDRDQRGKSILLSDKTQGGEPDTEFYRGAKVTLRIEYDSSRKFEPNH